MAEAHNSTHIFPCKNAFVSAEKHLSSVELYGIMSNMKRIVWISCILALLLSSPIGCTILGGAKTANVQATAETEQVTLSTASSEETIDFSVSATATVPLTPIPTPSPIPTPEPTPTPTPTEAPTPTPEPLRFLPSQDLPLPDENTPMQKGRLFWIDGYVSSESPLTAVRAVILSKDGKEVQAVEKTFSASEQVKEYRLLDDTFSKKIECLSENIKFQSLSVGSYTLRLSAEDAAGNNAVLAEAPFRISNSGWLQLLPNNLRCNYQTALRFFGSPERFLFRYRLQGESTHITVDSAWREQYDAEAAGVNGKKWRCHIDAVPYFEKAARYIDNTYIHIIGKTPGRRFDTGALRLADLVTFNGTIVRRFVNSNTFVSHHSFGTAVDINAHFASHKDILENRDKIYREVTKNLTYNGIVEIDGKQCYDFTYTGSAKAGLSKVPEPLMNYLLYELGFFRAGFSWGVYFPHTSDAMHFTLTELSPSYFVEGPYAMRKVFTYLEDEEASTPSPDAGTEPSASPDAAPSSVEGTASESPAPSPGADAAPSDMPSDDAASTDSPAETAAP